MCFVDLQERLPMGDSPAQSIRPSAMSIASTTTRLDPLPEGPAPITLAMHVALVRRVRVGEQRDR